MAHTPGHTDTSTTTTTVPGDPFGGGVGGTGIGGGAGLDSDERTIYDAILAGQEASTKTPLGNGFLREYELPTEFTDPAEGPLYRYVTAEDFLTNDEYQADRRRILGTGTAFKYIYFPTDIGAQARQLTPYLRVQAKNILAAAGLIDLTKTIGADIDDEFLKGIKAAMTFSMNNGGQMSWSSAAKLLANSAQATQASAASGVYTFGDEALNEYVADIKTKAETRKGAPLSDYEKKYITAKLLEGPVEEFKGSLSGLGAGTAPTLSYDKLTGQVTQLAGTPAEEPDVGILTEGGQEVLDEVFKPREELQRQADIEDDTFYRMNRNLAGLKSAEAQSVMRRG